MPTAASRFGLLLGEDASRHGDVEAGLLAHGGHQLLEALHRLLVGATDRQHDAELGRADGGRLAGRRDELVAVEERGGLHDGVELRGLRAEVAVLGAAAGLGGEDALHLHLGTAPGQPHLVGEGGERRHALVGDRRQRGQLVGGELATLGEEGFAGRVEEGPGVGHDWDVRTGPVSGSNP